MRWSTYYKFCISVVCIKNFHFVFRPHSLQRVKKTERYLLSLPPHHQKLLSKYRDHLQEVKRCIENNDQIIKLIIKDVAHIFENVSPNSEQTDSVRQVYLVCSMYKLFLLSYCYDRLTVSSPLVISILTIKNTCRFGPCFKMHRSQHSLQMGSIGADKFDTFEFRSLIIIFSVLFLYLKIIHLKITDILIDCYEE